MTPALLVGAAMAASAPLVLWWALSGRNTGTKSRAVLTAGLEPVTDLRQMLLTNSGSDRFVDPVMASMARSARRLTPAGLLDGLERRLFLAGAPQAWPLERVLAAKFVLSAIGLVIGLVRFLGSPSPFAFILAVALPALGFFGPDFRLSQLAQARQNLIRLHLPDTLDQLTIAVEAGLGLEAALARVARTGDTPLAQELQRVLQDIQAGVSRGDALRGLVDRTDVPEVRLFVRAVLQAEGYGIPIATVLRVQAAELRVKRRQAAEERAMKLPVKVIFPLMLCILPTVFIVILGPAFIQISDNLLK